MKITRFSFHNHLCWFWIVLRNKFCLYFSIMESSTSSFSSLTLFECTIGNATMLVDSMSSKELLSAWRISGHLQSKIVDVLEPRMAELTDVAEMHSKCPPRASSPLQSELFIEGGTDGVSATKVPRVLEYDHISEEMQRPDRNILVKKRRKRKIRVLMIAWFLKRYAVMIRIKFKCYI